MIDTNPPARSVGDHEQLPWGLWIFGGMVAVAVGLYVSAQFGQKLGARQTFLLHQIYESAMGATVEIR